jgi:hypothetical protein
MFFKIFLRRAAKAYAANLPHRLAHDFGAREYYTEPQILEAIKASGLNPRFAVLGFARFMSESDFCSTRRKLPLDYRTARLMVVNEEPIQMTSAHGSPDRNYGSIWLP